MKALLLAIALLIAVPVVSAQDTIPPPPPPPVTPPPVEDQIPVKNVALTPGDAAPTSSADLQADLRKLWNGHVFWARSAVLASHYDDAMAKEAAAAKADENTRDLANAITPFYGQGQADQLYELLAGHGAAVMDYMEASFADDSAAADSAMTTLSTNAGDIADFLEMANPDLPKTTVQPLLETHVGHHADQIEAIAAEDFVREAEVWTAMVDHVNAIADAMASAITTQFPEKVTG